MGIRKAGVEGQRGQGVEEKMKAGV